MTARRCAATRATISIPASSMKRSWSARADGTEAKYVSLSGLCQHICHETHMRVLYEGTVLIVELSDTHFANGWVDILAIRTL